MHIYCETLPLPTEQVVTVDLYTKKKTVELFSALPFSVRSVSVRIDCNGKTERVSVPLAEILVKPLNAEDEIVSVDDAVTLNVRYLDREGNALSSETIDLVPMYYRSQSKPFSVRSNKPRPRIGGAAVR